MVFRVEGEFDRGAADRCRDGASHGWPGDAALAVVDRSKKPTKTNLDHTTKTKSHTVDQKDYSEPESLISPIAPSLPPLPLALKIIRFTSEFAREL